MTRMSNSALHYAQPLKFPNAAMRYGVEHKLLGLKFSGLGLHSVSRHAAAAFIASLSSSAFDRADNIHLRQAVVSFSLLLNAISVNFPTPTQNVCLTTNFSSSCWSLPLQPTYLVVGGSVLPLGYQWSLPLA